MKLTTWQRRALMVLALVGLAGPNGVFVYYALVRWPDLIAALRQPIAAALMVDALLVVGIGAYLLSRFPLGTGRSDWKSFVALSLIGGLGFSVPVIVLLNAERDAPSPG